MNNGRLDEVEKSLERGLGHLPKSDVAWLIEYCRKLENVAVAANAVYLGQSSYLVGEDWKMDFLVKALKELGDENE